jgi:hypothetical protein
MEFHQENISSIPERMDETKWQTKNGLPRAIEEACWICTLKIGTTALCPNMIQCDMSICSKPHKYNPQCYMPIRVSVFVIADPVGTYA